MILFDELCIYIYYFSTRIQTAAFPLCEEKSSLCARTPYAAFCEDGWETHTLQDILLGCPP